MRNNFAQGADSNSAYYHNAVRIGENIADTGNSVDFTGHSLGGGMASAASGASGMNATSFNAAGLNEGTITRYGAVAIDSDIRAYHITGEILTGMQEQSLGSTALAGVAGALLLGPVGALIGAVAKVTISALMPNAVGTPYSLPGTGIDIVERHKMNQVIAGLEKNIGEDQAKLEKSTGLKCNC
jgi:hypothetical protein